MPQALAICAPLILVYPMLAAAIGMPADAIAIQTFYIATANGVGLVGSYALEHYAREGYLSEKLSRFRAERDPLTLLYNRNVAIDHLHHLWRIGRREPGGVSVLLIDVDYFKRYNDEYGHLAGDDCLRRVAEILQATMQRPLDLVARYGGEEFLGIAFGMSLAATRELGERMRSALEQAGIEHRVAPESGRVTASIGVAWMEPTAHGDATRLIDVADRAMYRAKALGRNRVEAAPLESVRQVVRLDRGQKQPGA